MFGTGAGPLWVNRVGFAMSVLCPLCSALRTQVVCHTKSEKGQFRTLLRVGEWVHRV
jgi:hypothetical protein